MVQTFSMHAQIQQRHYPQKLLLAAMGHGDTTGSNRSMQLVGLMLVAQTSTTI